MVDLLPFPAQPADVAWPTEAWEVAEAPAATLDAGMEAALDRLIGPGVLPEVGHTNAVAIVHRGRIVTERYGEREMGPLAELAGVQPGPISADDVLYSWSMAKSICHLSVGIAVARGLVDISEPAPVAAWQAEGDPRAAITWDDLLQMRPGLEWTEVYEGFEPGDIPDVIKMLFGPGQDDVAAYAADRPLIHPPGSPEAYAYSSGTTNIVQACLQQVLGLSGPQVTEFLKTEIFDPIGATSARFGFDPSGTWIASSYADLTARDWLRFGLLALRGGTWDGREIVPSSWIDHGRTPRTFDETMHHGAHWWARPTRDDGMFMAHGFEGQRLLMVPGRDLVVFRQGKTDSTLLEVLNAEMLALVDLFPMV